MPQRAAGYVRVSTEDQVDGLSLAGQRREIARHCEQHGYELVTVYADEGVSAHTDRIERRPALAALLDAAPTRQFDLVVVHTLDRWARNIGVQRAALTQLGAAGIGFSSVTENIDFTTPAGRLMITMLGATSEFFSDQLAVHVSRSFRERAVTGLPAGPVPFGYEVPDPGGVPVVNEREGAAVREVFERRAAGETNGAIARWLNAQGSTTRKGHMFTAHAIKDMLTIRFYAGVVTYKSEEFPGQHEAIIPEDLWQRVAQRRRAGHRPRTNSRGTARGTLHGRLSCGRCGRPLHHEANKSENAIYRERHAHRCETNGRSVAASKVDGQIGEIVRAVDLDPAWRQRMLELAAAAPGAPDVQRLKEQKRRTGRAYADGGISESEYAARIADVDAQLRAATPAPMPALDAVAALLDDLPAMWAKATTDERRQLIEPLFDRVFLDIETRLIGAFTPAPAFSVLLENAVKKTSRPNVALVSPDELKRLDIQAWWRRGRVELPVQRASGPDLLRE